MQRVASLLICALLGACATTPPPGQVSGLLHDALVPPPSQVIDAGQVFALSPAMVEYASRVLATPTPLREPRRELIDALYNRGKLRLRYDAGAACRGCRARR